MRGLAGLVLATVITPGAMMPLAAAALDPRAVNEARNLRQKGDLDGAIDIFREQLEADLSPGTRIELMTELGGALQAKGYLFSALEAYRSVLEIPIEDLDRRQRFGSGVDQHRADAQWGIAGILFKQGRYAEALEAYRLSATKYPFQHFCGNAHAQFAYMYAFQEALCLDWLGETTEAARIYFRAHTIGSSGLYSDRGAGLRLLELYANAGQLDDLRTILDEYDRWEIQEVRRVLPNRSDTEILSLSSAGRLRDDIDLFEMERSQEWSGLIAELKGRGCPCRSYERRDAGRALEAARLLARHPELSVPLLISRLGTGQTNETGWVLYALGLSGTDEAVAALAGLARSNPPGAPPEFIVCALRRAGGPGERAIDDLELTAEGVLEFTIDAYRRGGWWTEEGPPFPPARKDRALPRSLAQIKAEETGRHKAPARDSTDPRSH